jgi:hypothetical protein
MTVLSVILSLLIGCAPSPVSEGGGGGASETIASVSAYQDGLVVSVTGDSVFSVMVYLCHDSFSHKDTSFFRDSTVLTNADNEWVRTGLQKELYHLFVTDTISGKTVLFLFDNSSRSPDEQRKPLEPGGMLSGNVTVTEEDGSIVPGAAYYVYIGGSPFVTMTDGDGDYYMENIPAGIYSIGAYQAVYRQPNSATKNSIEITGDSLVIQNINLDFSP